MSLQLLPADEAAGDREEAFVDVVAAVGADQEAAAVAQPGRRSLDARFAANGVLTLQPDDAEN